MPVVNRYPHITVTEHRVSQKDIEWLNESSRTLVRKLVWAVGGFMWIGGSGFSLSCIVMIEEGGIPRKSVSSTT